MTIAESILADNLDDNCVVIDESELMADAADQAKNYRLWLDGDKHARGIFYFADGSVLHIEPCGPTVTFL